MTDPEIIDNIEILIREIKHDFYSFRNGIIVDSLKKIHKPGKVIYGLNVEQFKILEKKYPKDVNLAMALWKDINNRESRLFAFYLLPPEKVNKELAVEMIREVESTEEAEFLAFKILRNLPDALEIYKYTTSIITSGSTQKYCLEMFKRNLVQKGLLSS